jgi:hypothetical protein
MRRIFPNFYISVLEGRAILEAGEAVAGLPERMDSSYMGKYLRISSYIRRPFLIYMYDIATAPLCISLYMRKILCSFLSM